MKDIDEAIMKCEKTVADQKNEMLKLGAIKLACVPYARDEMEKQSMIEYYENAVANCKMMAEEHQQLADWLRELKQYREANKIDEE